MPKQNPQLYSGVTSPNPTKGYEEGRTRPNEPTKAKVKGLAT